MCHVIVLFAMRYCFCITAGYAAQFNRLNQFVMDLIFHGFFGAMNALQHQLFDFKTIVIVIVYCSKLVEGSLYVGVVCDRRETGSHGDE